MNSKFWRSVEQRARRRAERAEARERIRPRKKPGSFGEKLHQQRIAATQPARPTPAQKQMGMVEYALIMAFIAVVVIVAMVFLQSQMEALWAAQQAATPTR